MKYSSTKRELVFMQIECDKFSINYIKAFFKVACLTLINKTALVKYTVLLEKKGKEKVNL